MQSEEPVDTIMFVSGRKPEAILERDLQQRGLKVEWANSIKAAKDVLALSIRENSHRRGSRLGRWQLGRFGRASKVYLKLHSHCACEFYQYAELWWDALDCDVEDILLAPLSASRLCEILGHSTGL